VTLSPFIIAGLLDGPWVVIAIVVAGALTNWLNKRREEKAAGEKSNPDSAPVQPQPVTPDWEERLRRLLGEELVPPSPRSTQPAQAAPPVRRPPVLRPAERRPASAMRPPPVEVAPVFVPATAEHVSGGVDETVRRFEQMDPAVMTPVRPIAGMGNRRGNMLGASLLQPQAVRQAFIASLVFGPPKAFEG
jgi:hypothetical protein